MHFHLGNSYFKLKDWSAAKESFERAAELYRSDPVAAYNVAASLENAGFKREAITWYREVITRDPCGSPETRPLPSRYAAARS
jgi:tetratricopeptide (TPR) repeat protein